MWNFIKSNWLPEALGLVIACIGSRYLYKHPRVRAFLQPAKEMQTLITERNDLVKENERLAVERDKAVEFKEGLLDELTILRVVREDQRLKLDLARAEVARMKHSIDSASSLLHDSEIK